MAQLVTSSSPLLLPGRNCWRVEPVEKAAFLVDGEAYFRAFRDVALRAKHSLIIVGWDLDTKTDLVRGETKPSELPCRKWQSWKENPAICCPGWRRK